MRDITENIKALYGIELSPASVSNITNKMMEEANEWYSRTLDSFYPVVYMDAVHFKVREDGHIITKACYVALGINPKGYKDVLGMWIGQNEGAKFWLKVCNELKNRGGRGYPDCVYRRPERFSRCHSYSISRNENTAVYYPSNQKYPEICSF